MSGDASGKPTPSYKEILRSKDKDVRFTELLIGGKKKIEELRNKKYEPLPLKRGS